MGEDERAGIGVRRVLATRLSPALVSARPGMEALRMRERENEFMQRALALAANGLGLAAPNPMVGAVVVAGDRIVGEGWHEGPGTPHAEVMALREAGERGRGATLYTSLEPCSHQGRTPPCAPAV